VLCITCRPGNALGVGKDLAVRALPTPSHLLNQLVGVQGILQQGGPPQQVQGAQGIMIKDRKEGGAKVPMRLCEALRGSTEGLSGLMIMIHDCFGINRPDTSCNELQRWWCWL
jgi:hypothetical protein